MTKKVQKTSRVKRISRRALQLLTAFGFNPLITLLAIRSIPRFLQNAVEYQKAGPPKNFRVSLRNLFPQLTDFYGQAGTARGHYFHQDLWAARKVFVCKPSRHLDIGSRIDGFVAHLLTFMEVQIMDVLPLESPVKGLQFVQGDATNLSNWPTESVPSLSILHAAEHFGLGRYSDKVDPFAHEHLTAELKRILAYGGVLYYSVPIGHERMMFNAHRIFSVSTVLKQFNGLTLRSFSFVDDEGQLHENVTPWDRSFDLEYGCGLFEFYKDKPAVHVLN